MPPSQDKMMPLPLLNAIYELQSICDARGSTSAYFEYGSADYKNSIRHYLASSSEVAQLAIQPGSAKDLGAMMKVLKEYQVQFAVKCGGHGMAPTVSSTTGIQFSMSRFSKVQYNPRTQLVEIGADGVGVGGWLLGGGYSLKSNRYGLGIDHIVEYEIVTPDGRVRTVNAEKERDLFQALRGGGNNFGIVTKFVLKTYAQNPTYGAYLLVPGKQSGEVKDALVDFIENEHRQDACAIAAFRHKLVRGEVEYTISIICVFDAAKPKRKSDIPFQEFKPLMKSGEVWKADPAGWQLGQTELSTTDGSMKRVPAESASRQKSTSKKPKSKSTTPSKRPRNTRRSTKYEDESDESDEDSSQDDEDEDDDESDDEEDDEADDGEDYDDYIDEVLEEMSYNYKWHDAMPGPPSRHPSNTSGSRRGKQQGSKQGSNRRGSKFNNYYTDDDDFSSESDDYSNSDYGSSEDDYSDDYDSTLYNSNSEEERQFAKKSNQKRGSDSKKTKLPPRILVTKKPDVMGELQERGRFGCLMVSKYTKPLLDKMEEEAEKCARHLKTNRGLSVIIDAWPVHASIFDNSPPGAAYPHKRGDPYGPLLVYIRWEDEKDDDFWLTKIKGTLNRLRVVARELGLIPKKPTFYNNLSLESVPAHKIYRDNLDWLSKVKKRYDPTDVMGRAGGAHRIPLPGKSNDGNVSD